MITHFGVHDLMELPSPATYSPSTGIVTQQRVRLLKSSVAAYTAGLAAAGYGWELTPDDSTPYATVTTITSPDLTATWTLDGNDTEQSIWLLPKVRAVFGLIPDLKIRAKIRDEIERFVRGEYTTDERKTVGSIVAELTAAATGTPGPEEAEIYQMDANVVSGLIRSLVDGVESFTVSSYVLRKTQVLNPMTNVSPGFDDANKVMTLSALVSREPGIPLNISQKLVDLKGYWQKKTPQASQSADGRWTYTVEYWWAQKVDPFLYDIIQ